MRSTSATETTFNKWGGLVLIIAFTVLGFYFFTRVTLAVYLFAFVLTMHELGHFITARRTGMKATQFFIGFGPRLWSFQRGETEYGVRILPLGAFVKIIGMNSLDEVDPVDEAHTYRVKSFPRRALVISAGSLMHFAMALLALLALHGLFGFPERSDEIDWEIAAVNAPAATPAPAATGGNTSGNTAETTPAANTVYPALLAGLQEGDRIYSLDGEDTTNWVDFVAAVQSRPGQTAELAVQRDGDLFTRDITMATDPTTGRGRVGIAGQVAFDHETAFLPVAVARSVVDFGEFVGQSVQGIISIFGNIDDVVDRIISAPNDPTANENLETRPVSVVGLVQIGASDIIDESSDVFILFIAVNIFLGVFNLLPLLPFDGGHLAIATYERWRERGTSQRYLVDMRKMIPVLYTVTFVLLMLGLGLIYLDIANPVQF